MRTRCLILLFSFTSTKYGTGRNLPYNYFRQNQRHSRFLNPLANQVRIISYCINSLDYKLVEDLIVDVVV